MKRGELPRDLAAQKSFVISQGEQVWKRIECGEWSAEITRGFVYCGFLHADIVIRYFESGKLS